jgi:GrpB-like predicted nucleotidyltransferase (UPF0157 family)
MSDSSKPEVAAAEAERLTSKVEIVDYDPDWPRQFEQQAARIRRALGSAALAIEHVGSTSVPGLAAKPVIDIALGVPDSSREETYVSELEAAGFSLIVREPDWFEHRMFRHSNPATNLHVFSKGCPEVEQMKLFRDWLRVNRADRDAYQRTKRELAKADWAFVQQYADAKTHVVREIMERARKAAPNGTG